MFSLFKKKVPLIQFCTKSLDFLFSDFMTSQFEMIKTDCQALPIYKAPHEQYLDEMRGAYLQLFALAVGKKFKDIGVSMKVSSYIEIYLKEKHINLELRNISDAYNKAFGSSSSDGLLAMSKLFSLRLTKNELDENTVQGFRHMFYTLLSPIINELDNIKIVH